MPQVPKRRFWDGRHVHVTTLDTFSESRKVQIGLTREAAGSLANLLRSHNVPGTSLMPDELHELMVALDFVLIADPASVAAHRRMEASKGMTPDGGFRFPNPPRDGAGFIRPEDRVPRPLRGTDAPRYGSGERQDPQGRGEFYDG